jgi:hypothetical protein
MAFCSQTERPDEKIGKQPFYPRSSRRLSTFEILVKGHRGMDGSAKRQA